MDKVEQVARAICKLNFDEYVSNDPDFIIQGRARTDRKPIATWRLFENQARAAIEAMREPTEEMRSAVENNSYIQCSLDDCNNHTIPDESWRVMIDAALGKVDA